MGLLLLMRPLASPTAGRFHRLLTRPFQAWRLKELLRGTKTGLRPATLLPSCFAFYDALIAESRTAVGTLFPYLELIIYHFSTAATSNFISTSLLSTLQHSNAVPPLTCAVYVSECKPSTRWRSRCRPRSPCFTVSLPHPELTCTSVVGGV